MRCVPSRPVVDCLRSFSWWCKIVHLSIIIVAVVVNISNNSFTFLEHEIWMLHTKERTHSQQVQAQGTAVGRLGRGTWCSICAWWISAVVRATTRHLAFPVGGQVRRNGPKLKPILPIVFAQWTSTFFDREVPIGIVERGISSRLPLMVHDMWDGMGCPNVVLALLTNQCQVWPPTGEARVQREMVAVC